MNSWGDDEEAERQHDVVQGADDGADRELALELMLGLTGFVLSYLVCVPLGVLKAVKHRIDFDSLRACSCSWGTPCQAGRSGLLCSFSLEVEASGMSFPSVASALTHGSP